MGEQLQLLLEKLTGLGCEPKKSGSRWAARCPAHKDQRPSLSVTESNSGLLLVKCHAGCTTQSVVEALGLSMRDLFSSETRSVASGGRGEIACTYDYCDENGELLFQVVRTSPKGFFQRRPDGQGGWSTKLGNVRRVLYRLPELLESPDTDPVFVVEGEKDVDNLRRLGLTATTNSGGAKKWKKEYSKSLRNRQVIILPDRDEVGQKHAQLVAELLHGIASIVKIVRVPVEAEHSDVSDWLGQGGNAAKLLDLVASAPQWSPQSKQTGRRASLVRASDVEPRAVEWLWPGRIPYGKLTVIAGDPGLGKSFVTLDIIARVTTGLEMPDGSINDKGPGSAILLSAEDDFADTIRPRLDAVGADVCKVHALRGAKGESEGTETPWSLEDIDVLKAALNEIPDGRIVVIDPVSAYMAGIDTHKNSDMRVLLAPLAQLAADRGIAIVLVTHLNKASGSKAIYRTSGSLALPAAARAVSLVTSDQNDENLRIFIPVKSNLGAQASPLAFRIEGDPPRVMWDEAAVTNSIEELLSQSHDYGELSAMGEAIGFLEIELADGPVASKKIKNRASDIGISNSTLRRARDSLEITSSRVGFGSDGEWRLSLPDGHRCSTDHKEAHAVGVSENGMDEHL